MIICWHICNISWCSFICDSVKYGYICQVQRYAQLLSVGSYNYLSTSSTRLTNPALDDVSLPDKLQEGGVVNQVGLATVSIRFQGGQFLFQCCHALADVISIVVALRK